MFRTLATAANNDDDVTAREIVDNNPRQNWATQNAAAYAAADAARAAGSDTFDFNAQTTLASSYGLLQQMYCNAVRYSHWKNPFGPGIADIHPRFLSDTAVNLQNGDGTLHVATIQLLYQLDNASSGVYQPLFGVAPYRIDQFSSFADFEAKWQIALQFYNYYQTGYAASVLSFADDYTPMRVDTGIRP